MCLLPTNGNDGFTVVTFWPIKDNIVITMNILESEVYLVSFQFISNFRSSGYLSSCSKMNSKMFMLS